MYSLRWEGANDSPRAPGYMCTTPLERHFAPLKQSSFSKATVVDCSDYNSLTQAASAIADNNKGFQKLLIPDYSDNILQNKSQKCNYRQKNQGFQDLLGLVFPSTSNHMVSLECCMLFAFVVHPTPRAEPEEKKNAHGHAQPQREPMQNTSPPLHPLYRPPGMFAFSQGMSIATRGAAP